MKDFHFLELCMFPPNQWHVLGEDAEQVERPWQQVGVGGARCGGRRQQRAAASPGMGAELRGDC